LPESTTVEGICLRRVEVGEHDGVVTFMTREAGKLAAMVRGLLGPRSKHAAACQMFVRSRLQFAAGRKLPILAQAEILTSHYGLREDLLRTAWATYACELLDRAVPDNEPHEALYELLVETLATLVQAADPAAPAHSFELRLLAELGYQPVLDRCAVTGRPILGEQALFCPAAGGLVTPGLTDAPAVPVDRRTVAAMRRLLEPAAYGFDLAATRVPPALAKPLRLALRAYVAHHLETEPRSAAFLDQLLD